LHAVSINTGNGTRPDNFPAGAMPNFRVDYHNLRSNITTGPWRAPTHNFIAYTEESFLDEVAHALDKDPVAYRLELLEQARNQPVGKVAYNIDRYKKVVELAAEKAGWGKPKPNGIHQGFGAHFSFGSYVAMVADVSVKDNDIKVHKITASIDCGIIINRTGAENQMEGGIIDGLGHAMFSEMTFKDGKVEQPNFGAYKLIKMADSPEIELHFVESNERPEGLGEPGLPPTAAAVANAIYAATGVRVKKMPFVTEKLS
jgi:isoquinoline 1-oxidoreductase beta subunit